MSEPIPVAFYAPLKEPDHPSPSGDRTMARLFLTALRSAGFAPETASRLRSHDAAGAEGRQRQIRQEAEEEAERIVGAYQAMRAAQRPRLWFTYHVYYKAPDWIGPAVADRLAMPYVVAEGSRAGKRAAGRWALGHIGAEAALDRADVVFAMTPLDREALEAGRPATQRIVDCPPFIDLAAWPAPSPADRPNGSGIRLLTVAMMRAGDKLASYRILAESLASLDATPWRLDIVGDGEAEADIRQLFAPFAERVRFLGRIEDKARLATLYAAADLFVWPAVNEAYGMALLEAPAFGCPVVAGAFGGVPSVVRDGETGLLAAPGDVRSFADAMARLIENPDLRARMCASARRFVREDRSIGRIAALLRDTLTPLIEVGFVR